MTCTFQVVPAVLLSLAIGLPAGSAVLEVNPDTELTTPELATKYGYPVEEHRVITDDGYILGLHRIPRRRYSRRRIYGNGPPVLLLHGLGGSSADWILMGPGHSLGYLLADSGYDVWLGNNRGNVYSRNHTSMLPWHRYFWDFSFHEFGVYDLPAIIDHILSSTGHDSLLFVGHSQGVTQFFVMASQRPEYNYKISLMIGLAPAAFTGHLRGPVTQLTRLTYFGVWVGENFGYPEYGSRGNWGKFISNLFCQSMAPTQFFCRSKLNLIAGFSRDTNYANLTVIIGHIPAGASWKQLIHYGQGYINPGYFRLYDLGDSKKNIRAYNSSVPPEYNLDNVMVPIALFSSIHDWLATPEDVEILTGKLKNVIFHHRVSKPFNHYDFIWGKSAMGYVFEPLLRLLEAYRHQEYVGYQ